MSEVFNTVLGDLGKIGGVLGKTTGALKGPFAIFDFISKYQQQQKQKAMLDRYLYYSKHPEALSALAAGYTKPLEQGLIKGVGNVVQAEAGERGLNYAPGIYQQILAQALAPYQQANQQMGLQAALAQIEAPLKAYQMMQQSDQGSGGLSELLSSLGTGSYKTATPWQDPSTMQEGKPYYPPGSGTSSTSPIFDTGFLDLGVPA